MKIKLKPETDYKINDQVAPAFFSPKELLELAQGGTGFAIRRVFTQAGEETWYQVADGGDNSVAVRKCLHRDLIPFHMLFG